jgi:hypothetical protein
MIYYKIRKKDDPELYVTGTPYYQSYDKSGRIFQKIGQLRTFVTGVMNSDSRSDNGRNRVSEWEVVELEMVIKEVKGVHEIITAKKLKELIMK